MITDKGWCIVELLGHRKLASYVSDDDGLFRIDIYDEDPERLEGDEIRRTGCQPIAFHDPKILTTVEQRRDDNARST
jgi:hypothetical protein